MNVIPQDDLDRHALLAVRAFVRGRAGKKFGLTPASITKVELWSANEPGWYVGRPNAGRASPFDPDVWWPAGLTFKLHWFNKYDQPMQHVWWIRRKRKANPKVARPLPAGFSW